MRQWRWPGMVVENLFAGDGTSDLEGGSDHTWDYSDGVWDSEFEGSLDSEEEREISEEVEYLKAVRDGRLSPDWNNRVDVLRDAAIEAFFDKIFQAFRAVLNEIPSTLQLLAVYWTSVNPLQIHKLLPPLPRLVELHINRSSVLCILLGDIYEEPPTVLFPQLLYLYISGYNNPRKLSFGDELARIAPNLTSLRCCMWHLSREPRSSESPEPHDSEGPKHDFNFHEGGIFIESIGCSEEKYVVAEKNLKREFGEFKYAVNFYLIDESRSNCPKIWQKWWTDQMLGNDDDDDGPWRSPNHAMRIGGY